MTEVARLQKLLKGVYASTIEDKNRACTVIQVDWKLWDEIEEEVKRYEQQRQRNAGEHDSLVLG